LAGTALQILPIFNSLLLAMVPAAHKKQSVFYLQKSRMVSLRGVGPCPYAPPPSPPAALA